MAGLQDELKELATERSHMQALAKRCRLRSSEVAAATFEHAVPAALRGLIGLMNTENGVDGILDLTRGYKWVERDEPTSMFGVQINTINEELTKLAFGQQLDDVAHLLAAETDVPDHVALAVLETTVGLAVLLAVRSAGGELGPDSLTPISDEWNGPGDGPEPMVGAGVGAAVGSADRAGGADGGSSNRAGRLGVSVVGVAAVLALIGVAVPRGSDGDDVATDGTEAADAVAPEVDPDDRSMVTVTVDGDSDELDVTVTEDPNADDQANTADTGAAGDAAADGSEETNAGPIVTYSIPMHDVEDPDNPASGTLRFDFNTETGEVCYVVSSVDIQGPYRTHIHVGGEGEKGGIVVDLGPQQNGAAGCVSNLPADIAAILADRDGHYAELHDLSEEWTIRAQLTESIEDHASLPDDVVFEPGSAGASILIDGGTLVLQGEVPDEDTRRGLLALFAGVDLETPVIDTLAVVPGAPLPSGRILLADASFGANSAEVPEIDEATADAITTLFASNEAWTITAVGRTDELGSELDNLELSLRRAQALRDYAADIGVPIERVRVRGAGEAPVDGQESGSTGLDSRRAEFEFVPAS